MASESETPGIEQQGGALAGLVRGATPRAMCVGAVMCALIGLGAPYAVNVMHASTLGRRGPRCRSGIRRRQLLPVGHGGPPPRWVPVGGGCPAHLAGRRAWWDGPTASRDRRKVSRPRASAAVPGSRGRVL